MMQRMRRTMYFLGPAFVAAVAYVDPGNFAANFSAGAEYGYALLWVLVLANIMASLVQYHSAKVGIVTGQTLPEVIAKKLSRGWRIVYWLQAELVAIATDLAEVIGGALALYILFGVPPWLGAIITGAVSLLLLAIYSRRGQKVFERVIVGLLLVVPIGFVAGLIVQPPEIGAMLGGLVPQLKNTDMVLLATAMLGATVMPHVVYLHSALSRDRANGQKAKQIKNLLKSTKIDVGIAMVIAGGVNIAMLLLAASALQGMPNIDSLEGIFAALGAQIGPLVAWLFGLSLLVAGFASTSVGAQAGAVIMDGLINKRIPLLLRRIVTIIPAVAVVMIGIDPTKALILSQVVLSFGIPFALLPLLLTVSNRRIMGRWASGKLLTGVMILITAVISILNLALIWLTLAG